MTSEQWQVIGGRGKGGILVRKAEDVKSMQFYERLSTGSVVKQIALVEGRLHYELVTGEGPQTGWVSMTWRDQALLVKHGKKVRGFSSQLPTPSRGGGAEELSPKTDAATSKD